MKRFKIKEFAKWHKEKFGSPIFFGDVTEYYGLVLEQDSPKISYGRFQTIVSRTMQINNY